MKEVERVVKTKIASDMEKKKKEYAEKMARLKKEQDELSEDEPELPERSRR